MSKPRRWKNHIIICGMGSTASHIIGELETYKVDARDKAKAAPPPWKDYVVIDHSDDTISRIIGGEERANYMIGDATDDDMLERAGIHTAYGIFPVLPSEKDNVYITIAARQKNPDIRIVASTADLFNIGQKLEKAGANSVISPNFIGGLRLVSELVRPSVTAFLDTMLRNQDANLHVADIVIPGNSPAADRTLSNLRMPQKTGLLALAVLPREEAHYIYNPSGQTTVREGDTLVVLGSDQQVESLQALVRAGDG